MGNSISVETFGRKSEARARQVMRDGELPGALLQRIGENPASYDAFRRFALAGLAPRSG